MKSIRQPLAAIFYDYFTGSEGGWLGPLAPPPPPRSATAFRPCCFCLQTLAHLLYKAAKECSCVDPCKIEEILGVPIPFTATTGSQATDGTYFNLNKNMSREHYGYFRKIVKG